MSIVRGNQKLEVELKEGERERERERAPGKSHL
jgi:hypothetical protein